MIRQKPAGHLDWAGDGHCTGVNGASVQPSEGQQHGMKTTVQAEQMKVCMLKSLLLYASSSLKSHIILMGWGREGRVQQQNYNTGRWRGACSLRRVSASSSRRRGLRRQRRPGRLSLSAPGVPGSGAAAAALAQAGSVRPSVRPSVRAAGGAGVGDSPSPANTAVPGPPSAGGGGARRGGRRRRGRCRPLLPDEDFCIKKKKKASQNGARSEAAQRAGGRAGGRAAPGPERRRRQQRRRRRW